jgi:hypothetical protein
MAGGVQAGTLRIDIVAEIARLQSDLDKAKRAVKAASGDIAASARHANDNLAGMGRSIAGAGTQSKLATHHLSNLSFQLQDIFIGLRSGQKPMTVFLQQGGQIAQIMGQAGIGVGGLTKAIGGMVLGFVKAHPLLLAVAAAAGVVMVGFGLMADEINETSKVQVTATDVMLGTFDVIKEWVMVTMPAAWQAMGVDIFAVWENIKAFTKAAINFIIGAVIVVPKLIAQTYDKIPAAFGDAFYSAANLAISALNFLTDTAAVSVNKLVDGFNTVFGTDIQRIALGGIDAIENPYAGAMSALGSAGARSLSDTFQRDYLGGFAAAVSSAAQARAVQGAAEKAGAATGRSAGRAAGRAAGPAMAKEIAMSFEQAFKGFALDEAAVKVFGETARIREQIDALKQEAQAVGLVGWERERLLLILKGTADIKDLLAQKDAAELAGNAALVSALRAQIEARQELLRLEVTTGNAAEGWKKAEEAASDYNNSLLDIISSLQNIGGIGGIIGGLLGILTGNTSAIGGPIGDLLNIGIGRNDKGEIRRLGDVLKDAIGGLGEKLGGFLQSAGIGIMGATAILGKQGTKGMIASGIGGILGSIGGGALAGTVTSAIGGALGAAIGSAVPVIGTIIGGLAGGALMKLLGGSSRGSAIISGGQVSGFYGDTKKFKDQAGEIAGGLLDTLQQIAGQFGTTLDAAAMGKISIGIRNGNYAVDTLGRGYTKSSIAGVKSFGKDAEAAVQFAIKTMLERGAIEMRAGSLKIIKEATDLEAGLAKALQFEEIMNMLEGGSSQLVGQVKEVRAQFEQYISIMKEAGAATEDLARVQQMQADQIQAIIAAAGESFRATFYSDAQNVAFAKQQIASVLGPLGRTDIDTVAKYIAEVEKAQLDSTDAGLAWLDTLYSLTDAFGTLKEAQEAATAAAQAAAAQKAAEKAAALDAARNNLVQAYQRESSALEQTVEKYNAFADSMADLRRELFAGEEGAASYAMRLAELRRVGALAGMGDETALGALPGVGRDFLSAAKGRAGTALEYQRAVALVARYAGTAEQASRGMASQAQKQLDAITKQVGALIDLNEGVLSLTEAIKQWRDAGGTPLPSTSPSTSSSSIRRGRTRRDLSDWGANETREPRDNGRVALAVEGMRTALEEIAINTREGAVGSKQTARKLKEWDLNGFLGTSNADEMAG